MGFPIRQRPLHELGQNSRSFRCIVGLSQNKTSPNEYLPYYVSPKWKHHQNDWNESAQDTAHFGFKQKPIMRLAYVLLCLATAIPALTSSAHVSSAQSVNTLKRFLRTNAYAGVQTSVEEERVNSLSAIDKYVDKLRFNLQVAHSLFITDELPTMKGILGRSEFLNWVDSVQARLKTSTNAIVLQILRNHHDDIILARMIESAKTSTNEHRSKTMVDLQKVQFGSWKKGKLDPKTFMRNLFQSEKHDSWVKVDLALVKGYNEFVKAANSAA